MKLPHIYTYPDTQGVFWDGGGGGGFYEVAKGIKIATAQHIIMIF